MKKNLVLGTATGYGIEQIQNFVKSFRKYNQTAEVVLLVKADRPQELDDFLIKYNIKTAVFETHELATVGIMNVRYFKYLEFLSDNQYDDCLTTDVRDLVFQSDPFEATPTEQFLWTFEEDASTTIGTCLFNNHWISLGYGRDALDRLKDYPIVCAGTIMGSRDRMIALLKQFRSEILAIRDTRFDVLYTHGIDQGIINYITRTTNLTTKPNGDVIGTIGHSITNKMAVDIISKQQDHITVNGAIPVVIHQYDRSPDLTRFYDSLYAT